MSFFSHDEDLLSARTLISEEIEGLKQLQSGLGPSFGEAVELCFRTKGRIILSGMGKSGHIARKVAATLASTGSPALFIHPGEASHGDLGMITSDDSVILFSNSGETSELNPIINFTKRNSIPVIGIVSKEKSTLAKASRILLKLPDVAEAAPINAPTTSTTMMLVLGDALCVALLKRKHFTHEDFRLLHPGGKIGASLSYVKDIMHKKESLPLVRADSPMEKVIMEMTGGRLGCACVVDKEDKLTGIITDGDLRRHINSDFLKLSASDIMSHTPLVISEEDLVAHALHLMETRSVTSLCVTDSNRTLKGLIHIHDCLKLGAV